MSDVAPPGRRVPPAHLLPRLLLGAATLCLVAAGGLMWWREGAAVFSQLALAGLALCF